MLNKFITLSAVAFYLSLFLILAERQLSIFEGQGLYLLRIREKKPSIPALKTIPTPVKIVVKPQFRLYNYGLKIDQDVWKTLHLAANMQTQKLKWVAFQLKSTKEEKKGAETLTTLDYEQFKLELRQNEAYLQVRMIAQKEAKGSIFLPLSASQITKKEDRLLLADETPWEVKTYNGSNLLDEQVLALQLQDKTQFPLLEITAVKKIDKQLDFDDYLTSLYNMYQLQLRKKQQLSSKEQLLYQAIQLHQKKNLVPLKSPPSYLMAPYNGLSLASLEYQIGADHQKATQLLAMSPEQLLENWSEDFSAASFLFNHYQLDKLRQLIQYSAAQLQKEDFETKINSLLVLGKILLIQPQMVERYISRNTIEQQFNNAILPTVKSWLEGSASSLKLMFRTMAVLKNWDLLQGQESMSMQTLALHLQSYQLADGSLENEQGEKIALIDWLSLLHGQNLRSVERSVTPGFWVQGISQISSNYRPGLYIRMKVKFPANITQYLILRGIYFNPKRVLFNGVEQPYHKNWQEDIADEEHKSSWYYHRGLKTLIIKATVAAPEYNIEIPY